MGAAFCPQSSLSACGAALLGKDYLADGHQGAAIVAGCIGSCVHLYLSRCYVSVGRGLNRRASEVG